MLKGNYKAIGVAVLAAVILFALLSRCTGGGGGKESKFLNQIQGYWTIESLIQNDGSTSLFRPREISITKNAIQLGSKPPPAPCRKQSIKMVPCTLRRSGTSLFLQRTGAWYTKLPSAAGL